MLYTIEKHINEAVDTLIKHYSDVNNISPAIRNSSSMEIYFNEKKWFLTICFKKYFSSKLAPDFSSEHLQLITEFLKEKINSRELTLNNKDYFISLDRHIIEDVQRNIARNSQHQ